MNMKWLISLSRVAILAACAIWLMTRTPGIRAKGHGVAERNHQVDLLQRTRAWFGRWLGDPLATPAAFFSRTAAGGVLVTKLKLRSP